MRRCAMCNGRKLRRGTTQFRRTVDGIVFQVELAQIVCGTCREAFLDVEPLERFELGVAAELARMGRCTPAAFKFMRKVLGLSAEELAQLFGADALTVAGWESGERELDRAAFVLLGGLVGERRDGRDDTRSRLEALRKPAKTPRKAVRIKPT